MTQLIILIVVLFAFSILFSRRRWYAPAVLLCGVWLVSLVAYAWIDHGLHPLKSDIVKIISYWLVGFCITTWAMQSVYIKPKNIYYITLKTMKETLVQRCIL